MGLAASLTWVTVGRRSVCTAGVRTLAHQLDVVAVGAQATQGRSNLTSGCCVSTVAGRAVTPRGLCGSGGTAGRGAAGPFRVRALPLLGGAFREAIVSSGRIIASVLRPPTTTQKGGGLTVRRGAVMHIVHGGVVLCGVGCLCWVRVSQGR